MQCPLWVISSLCLLHSLTPSALALRISSPLALFPTPVVSSLAAVWSVGPQPVGLSMPSAAQPPSVPRVDAEVLQF